MNKKRICWCGEFVFLNARYREMLTMEQIEAAMYKKLSGKLSEKHMERMQGVRIDLTMDGGQREHIIRWFVDTQAVLLLCNGSFPPWFQGFISRQEAEDHLRDMNVGCFLIRLSEKGIGYILSYKGQDRCRHFVINQTGSGLLVVSGDSTAHNSLTELIDHFKTTPIQPFGEYLSSYNTEADSVEEDPQNEIYDVVQSKPNIKLGVSVKALKGLWEQTSDVLHKTPPALPSKSSRKLTASTSIDRNSLSQVMRIPTLPKKNVPLRNSLSADFAGLHHSHGEQSLTEPRTWTGDRRTGVDKRVHGRDSCKTANWSLPLWDENTDEQPSLTFDPSNPVPSTPPQPPMLPLKTASSSYAFLDFKKSQTEADQVALQPNPLYQSVCAEKEVQPKFLYDNRTNPICKTLSAENTYQVIPDRRDNDTYEHIAEIQENNTYEDILAANCNTYASLEEMQPHTEKKNHKWWKLRPEKK